MLNTYIKNRGITQTLVNNNCQKQFNQTNWDADYDGQVANISVTSNTDGNENHFAVQLDNEDLANILGISSVNIPLHKRLEMDFDESLLRPDMRIELPMIEDMTKDMTEDMT